MHNAPTCHTQTQSPAPPRSRYVQSLARSLVRRKIKVQNIEYLGNIENLCMVWWCHMKRKKVKWYRHNKHSITKTGRIFKGIRWKQPVLNHHHHHHHCNNNSSTNNCHDTYNGNLIYLLDLIRHSNIIYKYMYSTYMVTCCWVKVLAREWTSVAEIATCSRWRCCCCCCFSFFSNINWNQ